MSKVAQLAVIFILAVSLVLPTQTVFAQDASGSSGDSGSQSPPAASGSGSSSSGGSGSTTSEVPPKETPPPAISPPQPPPPETPPVTTEQPQPLPMPPKECSPDSHFEEGGGCVPNQQQSQQCSPGNHFEPNRGCVPDYQQFPQGCSLPNAKGESSAEGKCRIIICFPGFFDKDGNSDNGCEFKEERPPLGTPAPFGQPQKFPTGSACPQPSFQCNPGDFPEFRYDEKGCQIAIGCKRPPEPPPGCKRIFEGGFDRVICERPQQSEERRCPAEFEQESQRTKCEHEGGRSIAFKDPSGCTFYDCRFEEKRHGGFFSQPTEERRCPSENEMEQVSKKCQSIPNQKAAVEFDGKCNVVRCIFSGGESTSTQEISRKEISGGPGGCRNDRECNDFCTKYPKECRNWCDRNPGVCPGGGPPIEGEARPQAAQQQGFCMRDLPPENYQKCSDMDGKMIIKRNLEGCVEFSDCIGQTNERGATVTLDEIGEVPDVSELLGLAFKLEDLKIKLNELKKKVQGIADYYKDNDLPEDKSRFERVSSMFGTAAKRIDEIKIDIRNSAKGEITKEDIMRIKSSVRKIKDVILKEILLAMLGEESSIEEEPGVTEEEIEETKLGVTNCGTNGECFDKNMRRCKPIIFFPEGKNGPRIEVVGPENEKCIMKAEMPEGQGPPPGFIPGLNPPYTMICKIPDYTVGVRGPEEIIPYCEGPMVELIKKFGTGPPQQARGGPSQPPPRPQIPQEEFNRPNTRAVELPQESRATLSGCDRVERGISKKNVCGNDCCEPNIGENFDNCQEDCMESSPENFGRPPESEFPL